MHKKITINSILSIVFFLTTFGCSFAPPVDMGIDAVGLPSNRREQLKLKDELKRLRSEPRADEPIIWEGTSEDIGGLRNAIKRYSSSNDNATEVYLGEFSRKINEDFKSLKKINSTEVVSSLLKSLDNAKFVKKATFPVMSEGYLMVIRRKNEMKFYRLFERTGPSNVVFPVKFTKSKDGMYSLQGFDDFSGLQLDFEIKKNLLSLATKDTPSTQ